MIYGTWVSPTPTFPLKPKELQQLPLGFGGQRVTERQERKSCDMYVTKGINREKVMLDAAKSSSDGITDVMVHIHSKSEQCVGGHYQFSNGKQVSAW